MNINGRCMFVTKERWFKDVYDSNFDIVSEVQTWNMMEYQKVIQKIKDLKEKQKTNPTDSRTELIQLKEWQLEIFNKQLRRSTHTSTYSNSKIMNRIQSNHEIDLIKYLRRDPRTRRILSNDILVKKIGLLKSIYEMEREICQLELMREISIHRNLLREELLSRGNIDPSLPRADEPEIRKIFENWLNSTKPKNDNGSNITPNKTNNWGSNLTNEVKKKKFTKIMKNARKDNFNLHLRLKKGHLKLNKCVFEREKEREEFLINIDERYFQPWNDVLEMIGINSLEFLNNGINKKFKDAIIQLFNLYLIPLRIEVDDIIKLKRELILECISFILLHFNLNNEFNLPLKEGPSGFTAKTRINENYIYKIENLRLNQYPQKNYMSSIYLFSFFIQKYLYSLNPNYVPNIENLFLNFIQKKKSITKINLVNKNVRHIYNYSINLFELLINKINKEENKYFFEINNFYEFFIEILKKICIILIFYQKQCFFVHRDLHIGNIMINFNLINDNNDFDFDNIQVKLIDFTFSYICVPNNSGILCEFMNQRYNVFYDINVTNPHYNKDWNLFDLKYFIINFLFDKIYNSNLNYLERDILMNNTINQNMKINPIKKLRELLMKIFNIKNNYLESFILFKTQYNEKNKKNKCVILKILLYRELLFNYNTFVNIMGDSCNLELFNPSNLLHILNNTRQIKDMINSLS